MLDAKNIWIAAGRWMGKVQWEDGGEYTGALLHDDFLVAQVQALADDFIKTDRVFMAVDRHLSHEADRRDVAALARGYLPEHRVSIWQHDWKRVIAFENIGVYRHGKIPEQDT